MSGHTVEGLGPRGHTRDERVLHEQICEALERDPDLDASGIDVLVDGSEVFLSGTVFSAQDRVRAGEIAARVAGEKLVYNRLALFTDGPAADSNLATESTTSGAVNPTPNGDYDVLS